MFSGICFPFVAGFLLAYLCAPFLDKVSSRVNRSLISACLALGIIYAFVATIVELMPLVKGYLTRIATSIPVYYDHLISFLEETFSKTDFMGYESEVSSLKIEMRKYLDQRVYILASIMKEIASKRESITNFFSFCVIMPISFFYFLRDWRSMSNFLCECVPNRQRYLVLRISGIARQIFANFFRGQFRVVIVLSIYYALLLWIVRLNSCIYLGVLSGLFSFIPFIGAIFSCVLVLFIGAPLLDQTKLYVILMIYAVGQFFEGYILSPKFVGKRTGLHPLWILFSFFAGVELGGITGVLIAIPAAAVIRGWIGFAIDRFRASQAYKQ
jgi:predicted PurR-regulated permease PerM